MRRKIRRKWRVHLSEGLFRTPWLLEILKPIGRNIIIDKEYTRGARVMDWMRPELVIELVSGRLAQFLKMSDMFEDISIMQEQEAGEEDIEMGQYD